MGRARQCCVFGSLAVLAHGEHPTVRHRQVRTRHGHQPGPRCEFRLRAAAASINSLRRRTLRFVTRSCTLKIRTPIELVVFVLRRFSQWLRLPCSGTPSPSIPRVSLLRPSAPQRPGLRCARSSIRGRTRQLLTTAQGADRGKSPRGARWAVTFIVAMSLGCRYDRLVGWAVRVRNWRPSPRTSTSPC